MIEDRKIKGGEVKKMDKEVADPTKRIDELEKMEEFKMKEYIKNWQRRQKAIVSSWENLSLEDFQLKLMETLRYKAIVEECWPKMSIYYQDRRFCDTDIPCFGIKFLNLGKLIYNRFRSKLKSKRALAYFVYGQFSEPLVRPFGVEYLTFLCVRKDSTADLYVAEIGSRYYKRIPNFKRNLRMPEILISW